MTEKQEVAQTTNRKSESTLNKARIIDRLIQGYGMDRHTAHVFVDNFFEVVIDFLKMGNTVKFPGLGNFSVRDKRSRPGRDLKLNTEITIAERRVVVFKPSLTLLDRVTKANLAREEDESQKDGI